MSKLQMPKVRMPAGAGAGLSKILGSADRFITVLFLVLLLVAVIAAVGASGLSDTISIYEVFPVMALPFAGVGLASYVIRRRWLTLVVAVVVCVVLYVLYAPAGYLALFILVCSRGVAVMSAVAQKRLLARLVGSVERSQTGAGGISGKVLTFLFGIPPNVDARVVSMDGSVSRRGLPWDELLDTLRIALVPSLMLWTGMFTLLVFHFSIQEAFSTAMTFSVYFAAASLPWLVLRTLNVRIGTEGGGYGLYRGLVGTATRMSAPLFLMLVVAVVVLYSGAETFGYIAASAVLTVVVAVVSSAMYYLDFEHSIVKWVGSERGSFLPDENPASRGRRNDDVPGTPVRDADSCFPDQKY